MKYASRYLDDRQILRRWMDPRLPGVRIAQIQGYLLRKGWKQVPPDRPHVLVFQEPVQSDEGPLYQFVPDSEQRRDYPTQIYELLAALAEIEDRSAGEVLTDMLHPVSSGSVSANGPDVAIPTTPASK